MRIPIVTAIFDVFEPLSIHLNIKGNTITNAIVSDKYQETALPEK